MRYRERVTVQARTEIRSPKGSVSEAWADVSGMINVPATIAPSVSETRGSQMITVVDRFDIVLAGKHNIRTADSIVDSRGRRFDLDQIDYLLGGRQTRAIGRLVESPIRAAAGS